MRVNVSGTNHIKSVVTSLDFYRHIPKDLTEGTRIGTIMSLFAILITILLFIAETVAFFKTDITTEIVIDGNKDHQLQLDFNITLNNLHCDFVSVDVWDILGTNRQDITRNIEKWQVNHDGSSRVFVGGSQDSPEVLHEEHDETLDELHADGIHAVDLNPSNFKQFLTTTKVAFVDFYAPWCIWCQRLQPTWEKFAEKVEEYGLPLLVGKVDCVQHEDLCEKYGIIAFPTLRWYENSEPSIPDYKMDRTVSSLIEYSRYKLDISTGLGYLEQQIEGKDQLGKIKNHNIPKITDSDGCQVSGSLMINRVPGNFHIEAKSKSHNLNAAMTNLTHRVNHLSFGTTKSSSSNFVQSILKEVPESFQNFSPIDGIVYVTNGFHQAHHHYIKVVSTHIKTGEKNLAVMYQFLEQSQIVLYENTEVPKATFTFDLSPMGVIVGKKRRKLYEYLTSLLAIIGGTFSFLGLIDATLYKVFKPKAL